MSWVGEQFFKAFRDYASRNILYLTIEVQQITSESKVTKTHMKAWRQESAEYIVLVYWIDLNQILDTHENLIFKSNDQKAYTGRENYKRIRVNHSRPVFTVNHHSQ